MSLGKTLNYSLSIQEYKWVLPNCWGNLANKLWGNLRWTSIASKRSCNTPSCLMPRFNLLKFVTEVLTCVTCALIPQQKLASVSFAILRKLVWHNVTEYYMQSKVFKSYRHKLPFLKAILCFYSVTGFEYWKNRFLISFPRTSRWKHLNLSTPKQVPQDSYRSPNQFDPPWWLHVRRHHW